MKILIAASEPKKPFDEFVKYALIRNHHEVYAAFSGSRGCLDEAVGTGRLKDAPWRVDLSALDDKGNRAEAELALIRERIKATAGVKPFDVVLMQSLCEDTSKIAAAYAGSDAHFLYTLFEKDFSPVQPLNMYAKICLSKARFIVVSQDEIGQRLIKQAGSAYANKVVRWSLGLSGLEEIDSLRKQASKTECRRLFSEDVSHMLISVGYGATPEQQQLPVIKALHRIPPEIGGKLTVIFEAPCYDDAQREYVKELEGALEGAVFEYHIADAPLSRENKAALRCAADLFIHSCEQGGITDYLQEYLYTESCAVMVGKWGNYGELESIGAEFYYYPDQRAVTAAVCEVFKNRSHAYNSNKSRIRRFSSWDAVSPIWESLMRL